RGSGAEAAGRHGRALDLPRRRGRPEPERDPGDPGRRRAPPRHGPALAAGDRPRRQADPAGRRGPGGLLPRAYPAGRRIPRQPRRRRPRRGPPPDRPRPLDRRPGRPRNEAAGNAVRRPGRDRGLADRGQRDQPHLHPRAGRPVRPQHRRPVVRRDRSARRGERGTEPGVSAVAAPRPARVGERERLSATMVLSLLVHGLLILGVGFALESAAPVVPTLDVILSQARTALTPEQADFLAQAGDLPKPEPGVAPRELRAQAPAPRPRQQARVVTSSAGHEPAPTPRKLDKAEVQPLPPGELQVQRDLSMARLAAEIDLTRKLYAKRPTRKYVSAS